MRFCTTCGRNFDNSTDMCPHDGTPLFDMGGDAEGAASTSEAVAEQESAPVVEEASAALAAESFDTPIDEPSGAEDDAGPMAELSEPEVSEPEISESALDEPDVAAQEPGLGDANLFDDEEEELAPASDARSEKAPSLQIAAGIEDALEDMGPMTEDHAKLSLEDASDADEDRIVEPIRHTNANKKGGGGGIFALVAVLAIAAAAGWYFVGGGKEALSGGATDTTVTEAQPPEEPAEVEPLVEEPAEVAPVAETNNAAATNGLAEEPPTEEPAAAAAEAPVEKVEKVEEAPKPKQKTPKRVQEPKADEPDPQEALQQELLKLKNEDVPAEDAPAEAAPADAPAE